MLYHTVYTAMQMHLVHYTTVNGSKIKNNLIKNADILEYCSSFK